MGKSLEFVKERIASGQCNGMENNKYESMIEQDIRELFTVITCTKDGTILIDVPYLKGDKPYFNVIIKHDPDADFEYFTMQRCNCDGTFVFFQDLMGECIEFTNENLTNFNVDYDKEYGFIPQLCTSHTEVITSYEDEWEQTDNYPIQFCPHCGKKIEISVVEEINVSDKYNELSKQRNELWKKCQRTDSKKKESELREQVRKLDKQIDSFYWLDEWKEDVYV